MMQSSTGYVSSVSGGHPTGVSSAGSMSTDRISRFSLSMNVGGGWRRLGCRYV